MKPHSLLILIASTVVYACQTYVPNLAVDPSFTYQTMTEAGMVIGGVSSNLETIGIKQSDRYADEIKAAIDKERPELAVIDAHSLRKKMDSVVYNAMMDGWTDDLSVSKQSITAIKKAMPNVQYATFARIEETSTSVSNTQSPFYQNGKQTGVGHNLAAMREMKVTYIVYEVTSGAEVWNGVVPVTKSETTYQLQKFDGAITYTLKYPNFPSVIEAFATASSGFAENLPDKK